MNLLVTGGAGFIGSNFIHYWMKKHPNDKICNLDLLTYAGNLKSLADSENDPNYEFINGDICDREIVDELAGKCDIVVHFAAESHVDRSINDCGDFIRTNVEGTRVILEAVKKHNIRFHHISTDEVFGHLSLNDPPFNEQTPYDPRSPYSASKAGSDHLVRAFCHTYGIQATISNCTNNYGPFQFPEKLIPLFITNILEEKKVPVYGKGENIRDWIHVDDHNAGVEKIILEGKIGETYCLGGQNEMNNMEPTKILLKLMGKGEEMIEYVADRPGHDLRYAMDISKSKKELGWTPKTDFSEGLKQTIDWYEKNEGWWKNLKNQ
jgi:dTDP-glucose 4,6-dehydratase